MVVDKLLSIKMIEVKLKMWGDICCCMCFDLVLIRGDMVVVFFCCYVYYMMCFMDVVFSDSNIKIVVKGFFGYGYGYDNGVEEEDIEDEEEDDSNDGDRFGRLWLWCILCIIVVVVFVW